MSLRYLIDTNIVSQAFRGDPGVLNKLRQHEGQIATATPVWHELRFGCRLMPVSGRRTALERFLEEVVVTSFPILGYDRPAADWHAAERVRLGRGITPPFVDGQIAAIAMVNGLTLVTDNLADFRQFEQLRVENWVVRPSSR